MAFATTGGGAGIQPVLMHKRGQREGGRTPDGDSSVADQPRRCRRIHSGLLANWIAAVQTGPPHQASRAQASCALVAHLAIDRGACAVCAFVEQRPNRSTVAVRSYESWSLLARSAARFGREVIRSRQLDHIDELAHQLGRFFNRLGSQDGWVIQGHGCGDQRDIRIRRLQYSVHPKHHVLCGERVPLGAARLSCG